MELTEEQIEVTRYAAEMKTPMIVKGAAGSGKSFITSQIADIFSKRESLLEKNSIAIVTFTNTLIGDLRDKLSNFSNLKINTAHETINLFLESVGKRIENFDKSHSVLKSLSDINAFEKYDESFLKEEFAWINAHRITYLDQYKKTPRVGRGKSVDKSYIWNLYSENQKRLRAKGLYTYSELANICLDYIDAHPDYKPLFTHLIIDEFQDLSRNVIEALVKLVKNPNNIVFVGDLAQSIYKCDFSWKDFDIEKKKTFELTSNFRNSKSVARAAASLLDNEYKLKLYDKNDYTDMISVGHEGAKPIVAICRNYQEQKWFIGNELSKIPQGESIAIISRIRDRYNRNGLADLSKRGIQFHTMHSSKGLEFDNVFIVDANENLLPNPFALKNETELNIVNERRLLYVAMTRARKKLYITTSGKPSKFLAEIHPTTISPVALDHEAYESLYNARLDELLAKREEIIKEYVIENEALKASNSAKDEKISLLMRSREYIESSMQGISTTDLNFRRDAKILILGGDGGLKEKDIVFILKKEFGLDRNSYEWIRYDEMKNFNYQILQGTSEYCDVIVGCIPHKSGGVDNLIAEFEHNKDYYPSKIHILRSPIDQKPEQLTKQNLIEKIKESNKLKIKDSAY